MRTFLSPVDNRFVPWLASKLYFPLLKAMQNIQKIHIRDEDIQTLKKFKNERLLFFTNHPTTAEPPIVFYLGRLLGQRFKFMASRQVFNWQGGLIGWAIRRIGAYSVIAGVADRDAMKLTRKILSEPTGKLVIFPEGEPTSGEVDTLMPFQPGVAQLGLWGLEDARKADSTADINVWYAFMKFTIDAPSEKIKADLDRNLKKLEKKLGIEALQKDKHLLHRFLTVGRVILEQAEKDFGIADKTEKGFDYRIGRVRHAMLDRLAEKLQAANYDKSEDAIHKWRKLFALVELHQLKYPDPKLPKLDTKTIREAHKDAVLIFDFIVMKRDYIIDNPTPERLYEWLDRYESYLFKKIPRALGGVPSHLPRHAHILFGTPYKLSEVVTENRRDRRIAVENFTNRLRSDMQKLLESSASLTKPLFSNEEIQAVRAKIK
ncbi:MAG TPA: 1-acyl-sn-glycerol-3-phosphate acyltransferase [Turneriella sp.]|nr:1-acyl-sn-glycerol-3-phosphate acyltransferase [Turneriella sp.]